MFSPATFAGYIRQKHLELWLGAYLRHRMQRALHPPPTRGLRHLIVAVCDHFEPLWATDENWESVPLEVGRARVAAWTEGYPRLASAYRDADGFAPRHTFFFPVEQYQHDYLESLAGLVEQGLGEVEVHLHHDRDTPPAMRRSLLGFLDRLSDHGLLGRDADGRLRYGFIHGNWALANARADGRHCGVDAELPLLFDTGCYADFTFPAVPDQSQPGICNQIYWPVGDLARRRAYEDGEPARVGQVYRDRLLLVQGPLALAFACRRMPLQIENADLTAAFPPTPRRVRNWVAQHIHVKGRPDWVFVKLHTHGAPEEAAGALLNSAGHALHDELTRRYNDGVHWKLHYVTARELFNIAIAAMEGCDGDPGAYRDQGISPPPRARLGHAGA